MIYSPWGIHLPPSPPLDLSGHIFWGNFFFFSALKKKLFFLVARTFPPPPSQWPGHKKKNFFCDFPIILITKLFVQERGYTRGPGRFHVSDLRSLLLDPSHQISGTVSTNVADPPLRMWIRRIQPLRKTADTSDPDPKMRIFIQFRNQLSQINYA